MNGKSPYTASSTYRYSPIYAMLLTLNILLRFPEFGKILFAIADVLVGIEIFKLLEMNRNGKMTILQDDKLRKSKQLSKTWTLIWMINPMSINICTRGSAGSL